MKRLFILAMVGIIFTACEGRLDNGEDNGGTPFIPEISISEKYLYFSEANGDRMIDIDANFEYNVSAQSSWATVEKVYGGIVITVESNSSPSARQSSIVVYNEEHGVKEKIEVEQHARPYMVGDVIKKSLTGVVFESTGYKAKLISMSGPSDYLHWNEANQWCKSYGWRMPTKEEMSKVLKVQSSINIVFNEYQYWTSDSWYDNEYVVLYPSGNWDSISPNDWGYVHAVYDLN